MNRDMPNLDMSLIQMYNDFKLYEKYLLTKMFITRKKKTFVYNCCFMLSRLVLMLLYMI